MSAIVLSASVRQNLLSLQSTAELLATTQNRLATGKKVNTALDNPTNYFTAAALDNRASDISNLLDSIGNGVQVLQAANTGITSLQSLVDSAKSIANQVLQSPVGYSTKSNVTSVALTGATASNLLAFATGPVTGTAVNNDGTNGTAAAITNGSGASKNLMSPMASWGKLRRHASMLRAKLSGDDGSTTVSAAANPKDLNRSPTSVAGIANRALPSVVTIEATGSQESGTGTGFVYDTQGHILTNNHVVAPAADGGKLTATFSDGRKYDAEVVGHAQGYDVAVIKLKNAGDAKLTPLPLGDSGSVRVGDPAIAIGAPFGLSGTVTTGIISAKNRPVASSDGQGSTASYMSALQTDASINPGNSGGPLLDASGAVIGINSAIQSTGGSSSPFGGSSQAGSIGLGFAIPIDEARWVADTLIKTGQPVYAIMGQSIDMNYNGTGAKISDTGANGGSAVAAGGPADKAGLKPGDVITKLDDTLIDSGPTLIGTIWQHHPGDQVTVTYQRGGKTATTTLTLGERKGDS